MSIHLYIIDKYLKSVDLPVLPIEGETFVIEGKDYRVYSRTWHIFNINLPTTEAVVRITLVPL